MVKPIHMRIHFPPIFSRQAPPPQTTYRYNFQNASRLPALTMTLRSICGSIHLTFKIGGFLSHAPFSEVRVPCNFS